MTVYSVQFDVASFDELDKFALLADQAYNYGDTGDWFNDFRGGLFGLYARLYGVQLHFNEVHSWLPPRVRLSDIEYQVSAILYHMDSALECLTFALNALGWVAKSADFRDVTDRGALRRISPIDIKGDASRPPLPGYGLIFPLVQSLWRREAGLVERVQELHDVSKHRRTMRGGGKIRGDPPPGFYESLGIAEDDYKRAFWAPFEMILLEHDPKAPTLQKPPSLMPPDLLEDLVPTFSEFVRATGNAALEDAKAHITLRESEFRATP